MPDSYSREIIEDLVDRGLQWDQLHQMMSDFKDRDRFLTYRRVLQEKVPWDDPIILPYQENLFVVAKPGERWVIQCECGHEFCEHDQNWKLDALINVRDSQEEFSELYPESMTAKPGWQELREYFCPNCNTLLSVEAAIPGYPPVHEFEPDIKTFYEDWIEEPIPRAREQS